MFARSTARPLGGGRRVFAGRDVDLGDVGPEFGFWSVLLMAVWIAGPQAPATRAHRHAQRAVARTVTSALLGSVSTAVLHHSPVPVVVLHPPRKAGEGG